MADKNSQAESALKVDGELTDGRDGSEGAYADENSQALADKRTDYYKKWDKLAAEECAKVSEENEQATLESKRALGLDDSKPKSAAEESDMKKREVLKQAKQAWKDRELSEAAQKVIIGEGCENEKVTVSKEMLADKRVVCFKGAKNSKLTLPSELNLKLVKVFIDGCTDCVISLNSMTISQHLEVSHCKNCVVMIRSPCSIVQVDLCEGIEIVYGQNVFDHSSHKLYHAGVSETSVSVFVEGSTDVCVHEVDYLSLGATEEGEKKAEEQQFITHWKDGNLVTEKVFRSKGNMPLTQAEVDKAGETGDGIQSEERAAELKKIGGNEAFSERNYAQAAVFYTEAIELAPKGSDLIPLCYANRSFANSKLGRLPESLEDAEAALAINPNYVKGLFRKGLALHSLTRYYEAAAVLSKALDLEPKNVQIKQAIQFAEMKARQSQSSA